MALRLPAFCGRPTREEAEQVLEVSVARQEAFTATSTSLTKQRREVLTHPERLENLGEHQYASHVELLPSPKKRSNDEVKISTKKIYGKYGDLSHERESSEQFVWLNRRYDETETQLSRSAMMPSIRADSSQSEGI
jgi:hypothetical protein